MERAAVKFGRSGVVRVKAWRTLSVPRPVVVYLGATELGSVCLLMCSALWEGLVGDEAWVHVEMQIVVIHSGIH